MRAFTKRIIWFFGFWVVDLLDDWIFYITHNYVAKANYYPKDDMLMASMLFVGIWLIPLIFMKDDKIGGKK